MKRPCVCDRFIPDQPFVLGRDCRRCWLFHNDPRYHQLWGGPSRGVGDTVAKIIRVATFGRVKPCPKCKKKQEELNRRFPYRKSS